MFGRAEEKEEGAGSVLHAVDSRGGSNPVMVPVFWNAW